MYSDRHYLRYNNPPREIGVALRRMVDELAPRVVVFPTLVEVRVDQGCAYDYRMELRFQPGDLRYRVILEAYRVQGYTLNNIENLYLDEVASYYSRSIADRNLREEFQYYAAISIQQDNRTTESLWRLFQRCSGVALPEQPLEIEFDYAEGDNVAMYAMLMQQDVISIDYFAQRYNIQPVEGSIYAEPYRYQRPERRFGYHSPTPDSYDARAELRKKAALAGRNLLRSHLTRQQKKNFKKYGMFFVRGGTTGAWYAITAGHAYNIAEVIGHTGRKYPSNKDISRCTFRPVCFTTETDLCLGDKMLAQKLYIEHFEDTVSALKNTMDGISSFEYYKSTAQLRFRQYWSDSKNIWGGPINC